MSADAAARWPCLHATAARGGCTLQVAVVPSASRAEIVGLHDGALRVRLAAPAIEGRANAALIDWLACELGLARRDLSLVRGAAGRRKTLAIAAAADLVAAWLDRRMPAR